MVSGITGVSCSCENETAVAAATSELLLASDSPKRTFFYLFGQ